MASYAPAPAAPVVFRRGDRLVIPRPAPIMPSSICIRCGAPADGKQVTRNYYWHHPAVYVALLSPIIYLILAAVLRKNMRVNTPLCRRHAQRRNIWVTLAWVLPLIGIVDIFVLARFNVDPGWIALLCAVLVLAGLIIWASMANLLRPRRIDNTFGEFTGYCEAYLRQFPQEPVAQAFVAPPPSSYSPPPPPIA